MYFQFKKKYLGLSIQIFEIQSKCFAKKSNTDCVAGILVYCERNFQRGMRQNAIH